MSYTPYMRELIKKVEATRKDRVGKDYPRMTPEEKEDVLSNNHPDYIQDQFRGAKIGQNEGDDFPHELCDQLEAYPRINPNDFDIDKMSVDYDVDVFIVGGGGAGASAALMADKEGANVLLATKLRFGDANTMMAQGGIQGADKPNDSPSIHYLDILGGGHYSNYPELVRALVNDAPIALKWLEDLGVMFDKDEEGNMSTRHGGGTSRKRMHSARDYTGAEIMRTLRDEVYNSNVNIIEFSPVVELIMDDKGRAAGALLLNLETQQYEVVKAKTIIIATGGLGRLHTQGFPTTNHYGATADGLVLAYRTGAKLAFMNTIQYHPTGAAYPEQLEGLLITEKVRGLGAVPVNIDGEMFVYHLETRDVEASAFIRECKKGKGITTPSGMQGVWLDSPIIEETHGKGTIDKELPAMVRQFERFGIDIKKDPILVYPTLHYQNGGVLINEHGESSVENLFVAGEAAGGIHGSNRLMGNSLLDVVVYGRRAGEFAAKKSKDIDNDNAKFTLNHVENYIEELKSAGIETDRKAPLLLPDYTKRAETAK
ncbi:FAD-binding protein [Natranaerofaba carboxydovora]|uniref:FAD-binding protein n=1 Tax=Natranaerofaba carboxydovora TaxID=2742683 RepID=UPI001F13C840|nr:FAD-binding protein [Natranaerofaba carboxydovora]UMZ74090.1 L-aspartate oxidase [Natranaerofaba carboxydovora]